MISKIEQNSLMAWIMALITAATIFYASSLTFAPSQGPWSVRPYIYHVGVFAMFSFFLSIAIIQAQRTKFIPLIAILGVMYGLSDEIHQFFTPGRSFSFGDVFLDSAGAIIGLATYAFTLEVRKII